jgi:signal peptidase II
LTSQSRILVRRSLLFICIAAAGCAVDLITKSWVFQKLGNSEVLSYQDAPIWLIKSIFCFETSLNEGALFGMGQGMQAVFSVLSVVAIVGIAYWLFVAGAARDLFLTIALGCITGGILGNLYDRVGLPGLKWTAHAAARGHQEGDAVFAVRDWLHFEIEGVIDWPIFNIADSLLVCGAAMLLLHAFIAPQPSDAEADEKEDDKEKGEKGART